MYESFFGLRARPFDLTPNPRFLVLTEAHREALSVLEYGIASRRGITALIGEAGTGKTTLIAAAVQRQPARVHTVYINNPALTRAEFVEMLAVRFQLTPEARTSKAALLMELEAALRARDERGETSVLIIDEAQSLSLELLEEIRLLGNIETSETKLLSIVLAGQPELSARLNEESLRQLKQRVALRCELGALTESETAGYLAGRIRAAGGVGAQVFTREAVIAIHQRAGGIPRTISVIADNALLTAFAVHQKPVNSQIVTEVCTDLDVDQSRARHDEAAPAVRAPGEAAAPHASPVLVFDRAGHDTNMTTSLHGADTGQAAAHGVQRVASNEVGAGMFTSIFPKRRRFSIFKG